MSTVKKAKLSIQLVFQWYFQPIHVHLSLEQSNNLDFGEKQSISAVL